MTTEGALKKKSFALLGVVLVTCLLGFCDATSYAQGLSAASIVVPTDKNLLYFGKWDTSNPAQYHGTWIDSYLRTRFTGRSIGISVGEACELEVSIDGESFRSVAGGPGIVPLNDAPLSPAIHSLQVGVKGGEGWEFDGLVLEQGALTKRPDKRPSLECISDSVPPFMNSLPVGSDVSYSKLTANLLGCDHVQISWTGLTSDVNDSGALKLDDLQPSIVLINLGEGVYYQNETDDKFTTVYIQLLKNIRKQLPDAEIVAMRTFDGGRFGIDARNAVDSVYDTGDARVHYIDTAGWLIPTDFSDGSQPTPSASSKIVRQLAPLLGPLLTASGQNAAPEYLNTLTASR
jgi:hypothetical protein